MDVMDLRSLITVVSFLAFIGIVVWAYSSRQKSRFDEASKLPFADDEMQQRTVSGSGAQAEPAPHTTDQESLNNEPGRQAAREMNHG